MRRAALSLVVMIPEQNVACPIGLDEYDKCMIHIYIYIYKNTLLLQASSRRGFFFQKKLLIGKLLLVEEASSRGMLFLQKTLLLREASSSRGRFG